MTLKFIGPSFYVVGLTNGKMYECLGVEGAYFRIVDDSGEDYLYSITTPGPLNAPEWPAKWEIICDSPNRILEEAIMKYDCRCTRGKISL